MHVFEPFVGPQALEGDAAHAVQFAGVALQVGFAVGVGVGAGAVLHVS